jgi:hypothetical protein
LSGKRNGWADVLDVSDHQEKRVFRGKNGRVEEIKE